MKSRARASTSPFSGVPATVIPRDFDTIEVPFAERGQPTLVRWDAQQAALVQERAAAEAAG